MKSGKTGKMLFRKDTQGFFGMKALSILVWIGLIFCAGLSYWQPTSAYRR